MRRDTFTGMDASSWKRLESLFSFASRSPLYLDGESSCFDLERLGEPVFTDDCVLIKVRILQHMQALCQDAAVQVIDVDHPCRKAVLRMHFSQWESLGRFCDTFRALWTQVRVKDEVVILDAVNSPAWLAGDVVYRDDDVIHMAELFCGGFAGWTQAGWMLKESGCPLRTDWMLDLEASLQPCLEALVPGIVLADTAQDILAQDDAETLFLNANVEHHWWHGIWAARPADLAVCSPPCQPWSTAGSQSGLDSADGRLVLLLADIFGVVRTPVVCLEEVVGFREHPDFRIVMEAWADAGYACLHQQDLQLAELLPTWRKRSMFIFVHKTTAGQVPEVLQHVPWAKVPRPSLQGMKAYFPVLPEALLRPCRLDASTLAVYLDPWFLPP